MKIALCDDQKIVLEELQGWIERYYELNQLHAEFLTFSKPSELFQYMKTGSIDLIFLDLVFGNEQEDGIIWAKRIKAQHPNAIIIILTAYENRYKEGFEARAFRFMTKPIIEKELFEYLKVAMEELQLTEHITLVRRGITHNIMLRDVLYFTAQAGGSEMWTRKDMFYCDESLLHWENRLPSNMFFRCHSKYLVNLSHVTHYDNHVLTLINGEKIPVSRRRWKAFQIAFMKYDTGDIFRGGGITRI